jgi:hypothetical protein
MLHRSTWAFAALLAAVALCQGTAARADTTGAKAVANGSAAAHVAEPLAVAALSDLDFGMVASSGAGTVTVAPGVSAARFGGAARKACTGDDPCPQAHPARFSVTGESGRSYRITLPESLAITGRRNGGESPSLLVVKMTARTASRPAAGPEGALDRAGSDTFEVGGTLEIAEPQPPAHYTVTVPVIVAYS